MSRRRFKSHDSSGFTLIEVLFSLAITLVIVFNLVPILKTVAIKDELDITVSDYALGANQLSKILFTAKDIEVGSSLSYLNENDEHFTISINNSRLVKEPGFDILIHNVTDVIFYRQDKNIYMEISNGQNQYTYLIACDYQVEVVEDNEVDLSQENVP